DGDLDILAGGGNGDGEFAWYENAVVNEGVGCDANWCDNSLDLGITGGVAAGDLDGDGDLDLLRSQSGAIDLWTNDAGDASSWTVVPVSTDNTLLGLQAIDVDGDGDLDVMGLSNGDWLENVNGDASTWIQRSYSATNSGRDVALADVDLDGDRDLIVAQADTGSVALYENETLHRSARFPTEEAVRSAGTYRMVRTGDVDRDGDLDILAVAQSGNEVVWLERFEVEGFDWSELVISSVFESAEALDTADFNNDGELDVVAVSSSTTSTDNVRVWINLGMFSEGSTWSSSNVAGSDFPDARWVQAADIDGDGDDDIVATSRNQAEIAWWENTGTDGLTWLTKNTVSSTFTGATTVTVIDLDRDSDLDLLVGGTGGSQDPTSWFENTAGDGSAWTEHTITATGLGTTQAPAIAIDLDQDGDPDVVTITDNNELLWLENTVGDASTWELTVIDANIDDTFDVWAADFDHDGDFDLVGTSNDGEFLRVYTNTAGDGSAWSQVTLDNGFAGRSVVLDDIDGDGGIDLLATTDDAITWRKNRGGQFALETLDTVGEGIGSDVAVLEGTTDVLTLQINASHLGRTGDGDLELVTFELLFEEASDDPLTDIELGALVDNVRIYHDDGDGIFETDGSDINFFTESAPFTLSAGVLTATFVDAEPDVQVSFGTDEAYFVTLDLTADGGSATPNVFAVTHITESSSTAEMSSTDIPLDLAFTDNVTSSTITVLPTLVFSDSFESGDTSAWSSTVQ
ncbi:MAG: VCBS repeat-containing protein, partial [Acidobacteriota bacterium]